MRRLLLTVVTLFVILCAPAYAANRWGAFFGGGKAHEQNLPSAVEGLEGTTTAVDASNASAYFLRSDGTVWAVGNGKAGELGNGGTTDATTAVQVGFPEGTVIVAIGEARDEGYAIDSTGRGWAWGANGVGSLCIGKNAKQFTPVQVPGVTTATAVQGGSNHVLWLLANGTIKTCGTNAVGQLGLGKSVASTSTATEVPGLKHVVEVSAGDATSAARNEAGEVFVWGNNKHGQVGIGATSEAVYSPTHVSLPGAASQVSAEGDLSGNGHTLALVGGTLYGWGTNKDGQIGDGTTTNRSSPVNTGLSFSSVAASGTYSLGLDSEGNVLAWGSAAKGALGNGATSGKALTPVHVDSGVSAISATAYDSLDR